MSSIKITSPLWAPVRARPAPGNVQWVSCITWNITTQRRERRELIPRVIRPYLMRWDKDPSSCVCCGCVKGLSITLGSTGCADRRSQKGLRGSASLMREQDWGMQARMGPPHPSRWSEGSQPPKEGQLQPTPRRVWQSEQLNQGAWRLGRAGPTQTPLVCAPQSLEAHSNALHLGCQSAKSAQGKRGHEMRMAPASWFKKIYHFSGWMARSLILMGSHGEKQVHGQMETATEVFTPTVPTPPHTIEQKPLTSLQTCGK